MFAIGINPGAVLAAIADDEDVTTTWFSATPAPDDHTSDFLQTLAAAAEQWGFADLRPEDTLTDLDRTERALVVEITVPGLTSERRHLSVRYRADVQGRPVLQSAWSRWPHSFDDYEMDGSPDEDSDLSVRGVDATSQQCAAWAAAWFERQLRRRITRREWDRPDSGLTRPAASRPAAVEWLIESPDERLDRRGGLTRWRLMRQPPSRVVIERPGTDSVPAAS